MHPKGNGEPPLTIPPAQYRSVPSPSKGLQYLELHGVAGLIPASRGAFALSPLQNRGINQPQIALGLPQIGNVPTFTEGGHLVERGVSKCAYTWSLQV